MLLVGMPHLLLVSFLSMPLLLCCLSALGLHLRSLLRRLGLNPMLRRSGLDRLLQAGLILPLRLLLSLPLQIHLPLSLLLLRGRLTLRLSLHLHLSSAVLSDPLLMSSDMRLENLLHVR